MYKNPLNNGDLSEYNYLKNQKNYGARVKKYENVKLKTKPTELQKYYQYLTYQQPILDDLNYIAERMRNEDIKKQKEDFNIIKDIHNEDETKLKTIADTEKDLTPELKNELFDEPEIITDLMPTINTELEMEIPEKKKSFIEDLGFDFGFNFDDILSDKTTNNDEDKFEMSKMNVGRPKKTRTPEELQIIEEKKAEQARKKEEKAKLKEQKAIIEKEKKAEQARKKEEKAKLKEQKKLEYERKKEETEKKIANLPDISSYGNKPTKTKKKK